MKRKPFRIQIESSSTCGAGCVYCHGLSLDGERLSSDRIMKLLKEAVELGVERIDWTGGDPLDRSDWEPLMRQARYLGMVNNIWTPGLHMGTPCTARKIIDLTRGGIVCFHIDSLDPEVLSRFRQGDQKKVLASSLKGMKALIDAGKPASEIVNRIKLTSAHDVEDLRKTLNFLRSEFGVNSFIDCVWSELADRELAPGQNLIRKALELQEDYYGKERQKRTAECRLQHYGTTFFVNARGAVSSCYSIRKPVGSIKEASLAEILERGREALFTLDMESNVQLRELKEFQEFGLCWVCSAETVP